MSIVKSKYGVKADGKEVTLFTLCDKNGITVKLINYGAILVSLEAPDRNEILEDITLGFDSLEGFLKNSPYFGATIGRYANRIAKAQFTLDGEIYKLTSNDNENHLHGGTKGFDKVLWEARIVEEEESLGVDFHYFSKDGEEGYPGNLDVTVTYLLCPRSELLIRFKATTDKTTPVNMTHHSYFNLTGDGKRDILEHQLTIFADRYTPVDTSLIPTGDILHVRGTNMDFTKSRSIGSRINSVDGGYDHNWILNKKEGELSLAARVFDPGSGRILEVFSTEPAIQFYSGNFLDGTITGKNGVIYSKHFGFCLEPQNYPDSPNQPKFPSTILHPGETYKHTMIIKCLVK